MATIMVTDKDILLIRNYLKVAKTKTIIMNNKAKYIRASHNVKVYPKAVMGSFNIFTQVSINHSKSFISAPPYS